MYTEAIYVVSGHGSCSVWREGGEKQTFEWGPGSYFVPPTNAWHQFFNASLSQPARWFSVTDLPQIFRQWNSEHFIFNNGYDFDDRFQGEPDYFTAEAKLYRGRVWETNFIPDIRKLPLYEWKSRGGGGTNAFMVMGSGLMESHVSRFESGYYKKSHRHGPGAHLYIIEGEGYVLAQRGEEERVRCDWKEGSLYLSGAGQGLWLHQHFNVGATPATYLVMNQGLSRKYAVNRWQAQESTVLRTGEVSGKKGGYQVEYEDEDPEIHRIFEEELTKRGITCRMKNMVPWCTGVAGAETVKVLFPGRTRQHARRAGQPSRTRKGASSTDGLEIGGGVKLAQTALGLILEGRGRTLLTHGGDAGEWSVGASLAVALRGTERKQADASVEHGLALRVSLRW